MDIDIKAHPVQVWLRMKMNGLPVDDQVVAQNDTYGYYNNSMLLFKADIESAFSGKYLDMLKLSNSYQFSEIDSTPLIINANKNFYSTNIELFENSNEKVLLNENYSIIPIEMDKNGQYLWFRLYKHNTMIDEVVLKEKSNYFYFNAGREIISIKLDTVFSGMNTNLVKFVDLYQYSEVDGSLLTYKPVLLLRLYSLPDGGVSLTKSSYNNISKNNIQNNNYGIRFTNSSTNNIIELNDLSNNSMGIYIENSYYYQNETYIYTPSKDNFIFHNSFLNNTQNAYDYNTNKWDFGYFEGGNYWSDYTGIDGDNDGIGDIPYYVGSSKDNFPLMEPWNGIIRVPKTIYVDDDFIDDPSNHKWNSIQKGISDSHYGDTILVYNGTYYENVILDKELTLIGIDMPIVDGNRDGNTIEVTANHCTINGFTIVHSRIGIFLNNADSTILINNTVFDNSYGIRLHYSASNTLRNNEIRDNTYNFGISGGALEAYVQDIDTSNTVNGKPLYYLVGESNKVIDSSTNAGYVGIVNSSNIIVKDLTLTNNYQGVLFAYTSDSRIENIESRNNFYGLDIQQSSSNTLTNNGIAHNQYGINLESSSNNMVAGNNASNNRIGINIIRSPFNLLTHNIAVDNSNYGVYVYGYDDVHYNNDIDTSNTVNGKPVYYFFGLNNQIIQNFKSTHLTIAGSTNIVIMNNNISGGDGIHLALSDGSSIQNNAISNNYYGIRLHSSNATITGNAISDNRYGIYVDGYSTNQIIDNILNSNRYYGIYLSGTSDNTLTGNNISNGNGITIRSSSGNTLIDNTINTKNRGLWVDGWDPNNFYNSIDNSNTVNGKPIYYYYDIHNQVISNLDTAHLTIASSSNITIIDNSVSGGDGINLLFINDSKIFSNIVNSNVEYGIYLKESDKNEFTGNKILNNDDSGVYIHQSTNNEFKNNTISNNDDGIYLSYSQSNILSDNELYSNQYGIQLYNSQYNVLKHNSILDSSYGFYLYSSSNNRLYGNNLLYNTYANAYDYSSNYWYNETIGNYWDDYNDVDEDNDGIGDTPYNISGGSNQDYYPLMELYNWEMPEPKTIYVDDDFVDDPVNHKWNTIKEGLNDAFYNDSIIVYSGIYNEYVQISMPIRLIGIGLPVVNHSYIEISVDKCTLDGFKVISGGIRVYSDGNLILNNSVSDGYGIALSHSSNNTLRSNILMNNWYNLNIRGNSLTDYIHDIDTSNTVDGKLIYYLVNAKYQIIDSISNAGYVGVINSSGITIRDLTLRNNSPGVLFYHTNDSRIENVYVYNSESGILLDNSYSNYVTNNSVNSSESGILLDNSYSNYIANNSVNSTGEIAIYLSSSTNNIFINNIVNSNYLGLIVIGDTKESYNNSIGSSNTLNGKPIYYFYDLHDATIQSLDAAHLTVACSDNVTIKNNNIKNGDIVFLPFLSNSTIINNTVQDNLYGIYLLFLSNNNTVYHNNLINNTINAIDGGIANQWDNGSEGNYWSDYSGIDSDGDGIGDTLYPIPDGSSADNYPLMAPWDIAPTTGPVHNINKGTNYTTIQAAIDDASLGDEIHVDSGTYYENVNITKQLTLCGMDTGDGMPVVDAGGSGSAITLNADWIMLEGFMATNADSSNCGINIISNYNTLIGNTASNNDFYGISLYSSSNNIISANIARNNNFGIYLSQSSNNTIISNNASNNNQGNIYLYYSSNNSITNNTASYSNNGIYLSSSSNNSITNNTANNIKFGSISTTLSSRNNIKNNIATNNYWGIHLFQDSNKNIITSNTVINNSRSGIEISLSSNNTITNNNASNNNDGIIVGSSSNNTLISNIANNNSNRGIFLGTSRNNILYQNNLINNTYNAYDVNGNNQWYWGTIGNYYSDYTGIDSNVDGIGDTPYNISGGAGAQDRYPFMKENGWLEDIRPPSSIMYLQNITYAQTYINWTWTNPDDIDFSHVIVYLDGVFQTNVTLPINYYNATNLTGDDEYTISIHTVDLSGNINQTWINHTARTAPSPNTTPPASVTGLQNVTRTQTFINWTWQNPSDFDFNHIIVYIDGLWKTNTSNNYYNLTGLHPNTTHTFSTRTVDINGNINLTWVNDTVTTLPVPDTVLPIITITSPVNDTIYNTDSVDLNYSVNEPTAWQGYSLDGETTITLHENTTLTGLIDGLHTLTIYANDTSRNMNSSMVCFMIDTAPPVINTVALNITTPKIGEDILVTVNATDNFAVTSVEANGIALTHQLGNNWTGTIIAIEGTHPVNVSARDVAGNVGWDNSTSYTATTLDTTPPAGVTNIYSATGESWINWTWTNPSDPDFKHTIIYIDGSFAANVSETSYNATGLLQGTLHTISIRTVDLSGNVNKTWVNDTAMTNSELSGDLSIKISKPSSYSFYQVGETVEFNAAITDLIGNPVTLGISAYADILGPNSTSRRVILSEDAGNFVGEFIVKGDDARGIWTLNINAFNATSSGQASLKLFFTGAYFIQPYTDSRSYLLGETANFTAKVVKPVGSSQPLTDKNLSLNISVYQFNTTTLVSGPVEMVFDNTTGKFHGDVNTGLLGSGLFSVVFSGNDTNGNIETESLTIGISEDFSIIIGTDKTYYDRNEPVNIHVSMEFIDGTPLLNTDVNLWISLKGFMRSYTATTNETGGFNYTFQPFAAEAGNYTITSIAANLGLQRTAESYFTIHGLYLAPPSGTLKMAENSTQDIDFILYNLGETTLTGITAIVNDPDASDNVDATIVTTVPNELQPSESAYITLNVSAGTPVPENAAFFITISTDQMSDETSELDVNLFSPNPVVVLEPDNIAVGLNQNQTALKTVTISNTGYGVLRNLTLTQPSYNWMRITSNTTIGDLKPGENTSFDIHIHSYNVSLGTYHDTVGLTSDNHESMVVDMSASITDQTYGSLLFYVENELGQNISGASISLIDDTLYQEYTAVTNSTGYALINDLPTGRYIYEVRSSGDNTLSQLNSVVVEPMEQPKRVNVTMQLSFIDYEWDVIPSTIDDWYQIILNMTFETDVPVPIIVAFPPYLEYNMNPGDVQSGTLTVANLGLVSLFDVSITPHINNNVQFTPIVSHIDELKAKSSVQIPYTIELANSASSCNGFTGKISIKGKYIHFINDEGVASYTGTTVPLIIKTPTCEPPEIGTGTIIGEVTDAKDGSQIDNARVVAGRYYNDTDSSGSYTLKDVKSRTYTITAYKDGYYPISKTVVVTKDTTETVNFQLTPITTGPITGIVTNANDGTLIEGARVAAGGRSDATDNFGSYTLSGVLTGSHTITASKIGFYTSSTTVLVTEDNTAVVNFQLTPIPETVVLTGSVSGTVTDIDSGEALPFALVVTNGGFDFTDESGSYAITGVPVGSNNVIASKAWYHSASKTVQVYEDCTTIVNFQLKKIIIPPVPIPDCECISGTPPVIWVYKGHSFKNIILPPTTPSKMLVENCNDEGTIEFSDAYAATISLNSLWIPSLSVNIGTILSSVYNIPVGDIWHNEFIPKQIDPNEETMLDVENMSRFFSDMESFGITLPIPDIFGGALGFVYGPYPYDTSRNCLKIIPLGGMEIKEGSINIVFPPLPPWPPWPDGDPDDGPGPVPPRETACVHRNNT